MDDGWAGRKQVDDLVAKQVLHFIWHAGQGDEDFALLAEDRAGGRTLVIGDDLCGSRLIALQFMDFFGFAAKPADDGLHTLPCFFVPYFITFEILAKGIHRQVITSGSETAGKDEKVGNGKAIVNRFQDLRDVIADTHLAG